MTRSGADHHEDFSRDEPAEAGSARGFGVVVGGVLALIGLWPVVRGAGPRLWVLAPAGVLLLLAILRPAVLMPLNRVWHRIGLLLGRIVNPLVLGALFFGVVTPFGLIARAFRKNPLGLNADRSATTYWVERDDPSPAPARLRNQF